MQPLTSGAGCEQCHLGDDRGVGGPLPPRERRPSRRELVSPRARGYRERGHVVRPSCMRPPIRSRHSGRIAGRAYGDPIGVYRLERSARDRQQQSPSRASIPSPAAGSKRSSPNSPSPPEQRLHPRRLFLPPRRNSAEQQPQRDHIEQQGEHVETLLDQSGHTPVGRGEWQHGRMQTSAVAASRRRRCRGLLVRIGDSRDDGRWTPACGPVGAVIGPASET
jgi:hypothetical protein